VLSFQPELPPDLATALSICGNGSWARPLTQPTPNKTFKVYDPQTRIRFATLTLLPTALFNTVVAMHTILVAVFCSIPPEFREELSKRLEACDTVHLLAQLAKGGA
jgi:hypothetical protein